MLVLNGEGFNTCFQIYETIIESFLSFKDFIKFQELVRMPAATKSFESGMIFYPFNVF